MACLVENCDKCQSYKEPHCNHIWSIESIQKNLDSFTIYTKEDQQVVPEFTEERIKLLKKQQDEKIDQERIEFKERINQERINQERIEFEQGTFEFKEKWGKLKKKQKVDQESLLDQINKLKEQVTERDIQLQKMIEKVVELELEIALKEQNITFITFI